MLSAHWVVADDWAANHISDKWHQRIPSLTNDVLLILMGEGFILLTRGYGFMGVCTTPLLTR